MYVERSEGAEISIRQIQVEERIPLTDDIRVYELIFANEKAKLIKW